MSTFEVKARRVEIHPHPNADALELAKVDDYMAIVKKGDFATGDLAIYIPEGAVVPMMTLDQIGLWDHESNKGRCAGTNGDRVKAIRLRGIVSQGLVYPMVSDAQDNWQLNIPGAKAEDMAFFDVTEGQDVAEMLGVTKYNPPIPVAMAGEVANLFGYTLKYDIENIQRFPNVLNEGEEVVMTEKLHGTFTGLALNPALKHDELLNGNMFAFSKGLGSEGLVFKNNDANANNLYQRTLLEHQAKLVRLSELLGGSCVFVFGETFGMGVQDLGYGQAKPSFRVFDIYVGQPGVGRYLDFDNMKEVAAILGFETVPLIYRGPFLKAELPNHRDGKDTIAGAHIREGVVIKPVIERRDDVLGRVFLKAVSPEYLLRKSKNATEYQ